MPSLMPCDCCLSALRLVADAESAQSLASWIRQRCPDVAEVVPAAQTVMVDGVHDHQALISTVRDWQSSGFAHRSAPVLAPLIEIPVSYHGPDLAAVAAAWGMSPQRMVSVHGSIEFQASFCGFSPGFSYLSGLPDELAVPRLVTPRTRVPAGSVALADSWCAVYPSASPGGWQILGTTSLRLWDQTRSNPALLPPGTRVRFVDVT